MIEFKNVSFQYEGSEQQIWNVNLSIAQGECVVLTGVSGCGKTTLTRLMNGLAPSYFKGSISGSICIDDRDITGMTAWEIGTIVGSVFQNPKSQFFSSELVGEVAFGCENHGFSREAIQERTDKSIETFSLSLIRKRPLDVLSSGEKQRVAIASVYAMRPKVFVCDEPTANLDLGGIEQLLGTLFKLKAQGYTLVIAEHRLSWLSELADRIIYMEKGRIVREYTPKEFTAMPEMERRNKGLRTMHRVQTREPLPLPKLFERGSLIMHDLCKKCGEIEVFTNLSGAFPQGSITAVTGRNGAGKSTLALVLAGLSKKSGGDIIVCGSKNHLSRRRKKVYYCGNDTTTQFFTASVSEELLLNQPLSEERMERARQLLKNMNLYEYRDVHPAALSGGQKQRLAVACAIFSEREILLLDEPTSGLDGANMRSMSDAFKAAASRGKTVIVITHDPEFMEECCQYCFSLK